MLKNFLKKYYIPLIFSLIFVVIMVYIQNLDKKIETIDAEYQYRINSLVKNTIKYCNMHSEIEIMEWKIKNPNSTHEDTVLEQKIYYDTCIQERFETYISVIVETAINK